jgi:hypothetical protein
LANDDWGDASPSRKMVEVWHELTKTQLPTDTPA